MYGRSPDATFTPEEHELRLFAINESEDRQEISNVRHLILYSENLTTPAFSTIQPARSLGTIWYLEIRFKPFGDTISEASEILKQTQELHAYIGPSSVHADTDINAAEANYTFAGLEPYEKTLDAVKLTVRRCVANAA